MTEEVQENQLLSAVGASDMVLGSSGSSGSQTASYSGTSGNLAAALVALNSRKPLYLLQDQLGSVRLVVDETGKWVATYTYSSFGQVLEQTGDPTVLSTNPIGFSGAYTDQESGYLYLVNRFYDPATAQFLSVDPLVDVTGQPYSYAYGDPVNSTDPLGLGCGSGSPWDCVGEAAGAAAIGVGTAVNAVGSAVNTAAGWVQQNTFLGHSTLRLCLGVDVAAVFGFNASGCVGETDLSQFGVSVSGGPSLGFLVSGGPSVSFSGACAFKQVGGPFWGVTGGAGPGGSYEWGTSQGNHIHVFTYGPAVGLAAQKSWTATGAVGSPSCGC